MRALRRTFPTKARHERSMRLVDRVLSLEPVAGARTIALFFPIEALGEVELASLDTLLRARGTLIAYPRMLPLEMGGMEFRFVSDIERMQEHRLGMREPTADDRLAIPGELDVIVVPALAADSRGQRIGYGGGNYDRTLPHYAPPAVTVAVVFDFQLLIELPCGDHDVAVDWVVTDAQTIRTEP